jgi:hypothetical protein
MPAVTPIPGGGIRAAPGVYDKYKKNPTGGGGQSSPGSVAPGGIPALPSFPGDGGGGGGGGGPVSPGGSGPVAPSAPLPVLPNTAAPDPYLEEQVRNLRARMGVDTTERAIGRSTTGILDAAALGAADEGAANLSSRGLVGSGAGQAFLHKRFFEPAQQAAAGASADIALKREQDLDRLVLGGTAIMGAPGSSSLANRSLGLQQWQAQMGAGQAAQGLSLEQQRLNQQQQQSQIENWLRMYGMAQQGGY